MPEKYDLVWIACGMLDAETIRLLLESFNIKVKMFQESLGAVYGMAFGPIGEVEIFVPHKNANEAKEILDAYIQGKLEEKEN